MQEHRATAYRICVLASKNTKLLRFTARCMSRIINHRVAGKALGLLLLLCSPFLSAQPPGNSLVLNGSTDFASFPHHALLNPSGAMTAEAWVFPCKVDGNNFILNKWWCGGSEQNAYYLTIYNGKLRWGWDLDGCGNGARVYESSLPLIQPNQWYHVAAVHTSTGVSLYVDGQAVTGQLIQGSYSPILQNQEPFRIGVYRDISNSYWGHFTGRIDEVRIWDYAVSASDIAARYLIPLNGNEAGLVAYYSMDQTGSGTGLGVSSSAQSTLGLINGSCTGSSNTPYFLSNASHLVPLDLGNDTLLCDGEVILLDAGLGGAAYLWHDSTTFPQYLVSLAGMYWVRVSLGGCSNLDTITVDYQAMPIVELGADTTLCEGDSLILTASTPGATYLWQDGHTGQDYVVTQAGLYRVEVSINGCSASDSVYISYDAVPQVNLGPDTLICPGETLLLNAGLSADAFLWQDSSTLQTFTVSQAGTYWVVAQQGLCYGRDSIVVGVHSLPNPYLGPDTTFCLGVSFLLGIDSAFSSPLWNTGDTGQGIMVSQGGMYWVEVPHLCGNVRDSVDIHFIDCDCGLYIPNAFSPNGDGLNEHFEVKGSCVEYYHLLIFNRWGQQIYESNSLDEPWDGQYQGKPCPVTSYVYRIEYRLAQSQTEEVRIGYVVLLQ